MKKGILLEVIVVMVVSYVLFKIGTYMGLSEDVCAIMAIATGTFFGVTSKVLRK